MVIINCKEKYYTLTSDGAVSVFNSGFKIVKYSEVSKDQCPKYVFSVN